MILYFTYKSRTSLKSFTSFISAKAITKLNLGHIDKSDIKIKKISRRGSRSPDNTELGHFTFLFCRGRQRNVPRIITHVHSYCFAHSSFCLATLPLPLPSGFSIRPHNTDLYREIGIDFKWKIEDFILNAVLKSPHLIHKRLR